MDKLPTDMIRYIASYIVSPLDKLRISLSSKTPYTVVYHTLDTRDIKYQCFIKTLEKHGIKQQFCSSYIYANDASFFNFFQLLYFRLSKLYDNITMTIDFDDTCHFFFDGVEPRYEQGKKISAFLPRFKMPLSVDANGLSAGLK